MIRCPACLTENPHTSRYCLHCGNVLQAQVATTETAAIQRASQNVAEAETDSSIAFDSGQARRFLPGTVLGGRYRIVSQLGKGGMGEVYQADDLKLGQTVALKFVSLKRIRGPQDVKQLCAEVRLARQLSHPSICRVYDISEANGQQFLSMEYVDGEDLATLLKRIGRLPANKGIEIAHQICSALAAAHRMGILHRDLKPSNVMIDAHGNARVTDFGLACLAGGPEASKLAGTLPYMSPELLHGAPATVQSDLYALGLVLREILTGERPSQAQPLLDVAGAGLSEDLTLSGAEQLDPAVKEVILQCLQPEPEDRPASAVAVSAILPGSNAISAAIAAGETPTPGMVATAGRRGGIRPSRALLSLIAVGLGLVLAAFLADRASLVGQIKLPKSPELLRERAEEQLDRVGYERTQASQPDTADGFSYDQQYIKELDEAGWGTAPLVTDVSPLVYWYRRASRPLTNRAFVPRDADTFFRLGMVTADDPPITDPGMVNVWLDPGGRLQQLRALPPQVIGQPTVQERSQGGPNWSLLFECAGLNEGDFERTTPVWTPPMAYDSRAAWFQQGDNSATVRVEAAAFRDKPVYFHVIRERMSPARKQAVADGVTLVSNPFLSYSSILVVLLAIGAIARHNWRRGTIDRQGTLRMGGFLFLAQVLVWLLQASHRPSPMDVEFMFVGLAAASSYAALVSLFYAALEPYVRRHWPETLISWNRLLRAEIRSPRLGTDLLLGTLAGVVAYVLPRLDYLLASAWDPRTAPPPLRGALVVLQGTRELAGETMHTLTGAIEASIVLLLCLAFLRLICRKAWIGNLIFVVVLSAATSFGAGGFLMLTVAFATVRVGLVLLVLTRYGLVALVTMLFVARLLSFPITADSARWYFEPGLFVLSVAGALALTGFVLSLQNWGVGTYSAPSGKVASPNPT